MKMRKVLFGIVVAMAFSVSSAFAAFDANSDQQQGQGQGQGQMQGQIGINENENANQQDQMQGQIGINKQGQQQGIANSGNSSNANFNRNANRQGQGQAQGQDQKAIAVQGQGQDQDQEAVAIQGQGQTMGQGQQADINIEDNRETTGYYLAAPNTAANDGQRASSIYSIFGGVNIAQTEEAKQCIDLLNVIGQLQDAKYLTPDEAKAEALAVFSQLKNASESKRVLGVLWKTRGNHLLNGFGFLACDNLWGKAGARHPRVDVELTGNGGYIN